MTNSRIGLISASAISVSNNDVSTERDIVVAILVKIIKSFSPCHDGIFFDTNAAVIKRVAHAFRGRRMREETFSVKGRAFI